MHLRAHLVRVRVVHQAHHLVAQAERLAHQGLVHQALVQAVRLVLAVLVQAHHQVLEAQATHLQALAVQEVLVAHEALVTHHR